MEPVLPFDLNLADLPAGGLTKALHRQLRAAILEGRLPGGFALPSTRRLASDFPRALDLFTEDGVKAEIETTIPCGLGECQLAWESASALTATCLKSGDQGNERRRVRYVRQGDKWAATTTTLK